jgi:hypothetical protein
MSLNSFVSTIPALASRFDSILVESYQRPYSWEESQIERLFVDHFFPLVDGTRDDFRGDPFVGTVVLLPVKGRAGTAEIVDGQQRTATLTMILSHAIRMLRAESPKKTDREFGKIIPFPDRSPWLSLREEDRDAYRLIMNPWLDEDKLVDRLTGTTKEAAKSRTIHKAYRIIDSQLRSYVDQAGEGKPGKPSMGEHDALRALVTFVRDELRIVVVEVDTPGQGLAVFEALNTAGLPLTLEQLLKNCLMRVFNSPSCHTKIDLGWKRFENAIDEGPHRTRFLLHYYVAHHGPVTSRSAYGCYRSLAESLKREGGDGGLDQLLDHLEENWLFYNSISGPVKTLGGDVCMPAFMAVYSISNAGSLDKSVDAASYALESALIRCQIGKRALSKLRSAVTTLCGSIRKMKSGKPSPASIESLIRSELKKVVPTDDEFCEAVASWDDVKPSSRRAGLFLRRINHFLRAGGRAEMLDREAYIVGDMVAVWACEQERHASEAKLAALGFNDHESYDSLTISIGNLILKPRSGREASVKVNDGLTTNKRSASQIKSRKKWLGVQACKVWYF